jgi:hypothetical protein
MVAERRCAGTLYTLYQSTLAVSPSVSRVVRVKEYVYTVAEPEKIYSWGELYKERLNLMKKCINSHHIYKNIAQK